MLHKTVLFVGDRPNPRKNKDMNVPFVGTPSYKTLLEWVYRMDLELGNLHMVNAYSVNGSPNYWPFIKSYVVIALGAEAAIWCAERGVEFFELPHPVDLNDKKKLAERLAKCKRFIYEE